MLKSIKAWLGGLSLIGKIVAYSFAAVMGGSIIGASASNSPTSVAPSPEAIVKPAPKIENRTLSETSQIPFEKTSVNDNAAASGSTVIRTAGVNGVKTITYNITYSDGVETDRKLLKEETTTPPVTEVTAIGTKPAFIAPKPVSNCDPNYSPCVPNVSYDLDCPDIGFSVTIIGSDPHGFDGNDNDGYGCESY